MITAALIFTLQATPITVADDITKPPYTIISSDNEVVAEQYPVDSLQLGEEGTVKYEVVVDRRGDLRSCKVIQSSNYARLDAQTCEIMIRNAKFKKILREGKKYGGVQQGEIRWYLPDTISRPAIIPPHSSPAELEMAAKGVTCFKSEKVGSMVKRVKQCMTVAELEKSRQMYQQELDRLRGGGAMTSN